MVVCTPGRMIAHLNMGYVKMQEVKYLVLDEADRMLDMGFNDDIMKIISFLPKQRQNLLFSATMPNEVKSLANSLLQDPIEVTVTPVSSTVERIDQCMIHVADRKHKETSLVDLLKKDKAESVLVFSRTKHGADKLVKMLAKNKLEAMAIHGNKSQNARQMALSHFKEGKIRILVATDIAARGLDIDDISHVINFDMPRTADVYLHRIGRTGRAGKKGTAISLIEAHDMAILSKVERYTEQKLKRRVVDSLRPKNKEAKVPVKKKKPTKAAAKKVVKKVKK